MNDRAYGPVSLVSFLHSRVGSTALSLLFLKDAIVFNGFAPMYSRDISLVLHRFTYRSRESERGFHHRHRQIDIAVLTRAHTKSNSR